MRKSLLVLAISTVSIMPFSINANAELSKPESKEVLARCKIDDNVRGFHAKGNCEKVNKAYAEFLATRERYKDLK